MEMELIEVFAGFALGVSSAVAVARYRMSALLPKRSLFSRVVSREE